MQVMSGSKGQEIVYTWARLNTPTHKELSDTIDAALRRAKAEGIRMVETYARACVHERAVQLDGFTGSSGMAGVIRGKQSEADRIVDWADARAAQIEEGE
jgi:hypothetical protein